jgi:uncharacterized delta-60 repeat protein
MPRPVTSNRLRLEALEERTLLSPGELDTTFGNGGLATTDLPGLSTIGVNNVAVQSDSRIVVAGPGLGSGRVEYHFGLARFNPDGSLDDSFGDAGRVTTAFPGWVEANPFGMALQPDGRIIVAGVVGDGSEKFPRVEIALARYKADGSLDGSFGTAGLVTTAFPGEQATSASSVALQADGRIVVSGRTANPAQAERLVLARYDGDGHLDSSFGAGGLVNLSVAGSSLAFTTRVTVQEDGHIVFAGANDVGLPSRFLLARFNGDGSLDDSFGTSGVVTTDVPGSGTGISRVAMQPDGRIVAAGSVSVTGGEQFVLARYDGGGNLDGSFGTGGLVFTDFGQGYASAGDMVLQENGRIVVVGRVGLSGAQIALARYESDGSLDGSFGMAGLVTTSFPDYSSVAAQSVALQADGRIVAAGFAVATSGSRFAVARYEGDPIGATHFEVSAPAEVTAGQPFDVTVSAVDDNGNVVPDYAGTVTLSSSDPLAPALGSHTFTTGDGGVYTFSGVQLFTAGPHSLFADDGILNSQADLTVDPGLAVALVLSGPDQVSAGVSFVVTLRAYDAYGNVATGYRGSVSFVSTDPQAQLPVDYAFTADDAGSHDFTVTLNSPGPVRLTAIDTYALTLNYLDLTVT